MVQTEAANAQGGGGRGGRGGGGSGGKPCNGVCSVIGVGGSTLLAGLATTIGKVTENGNHAIRMAGEQIPAAAHQVSEVASSGTQSLLSTVQNHPLAAGAGLLLTGAAAAASYRYVNSQKIKNEVPGDAYSPV
jgi:hypothetical protein